MDARARAVEIDAPAKVNLWLRVLDRDPATGFHDLETLFQAVALTDRVEVEGAGDEASGGQAAAGPGSVRLTVDGADLGPPERNLVARAARAFLDRAGLEVGLAIRLTKRIPVGAGLGGGSSDAAATLRALNVLFREPLPGPVLHELAAGLGSDVPFFLCGSPTALGWGRGDRLQPLRPLPEAQVLLVLPPVHVDTGEAYRALAERRAGAGRTTGGRSRGRSESDRAGVPDDGGPDRPAAETGVAAIDWDTVVAEAVNDFETVVPGVHPPVARALETVRATEARTALLSGSGAAVFALYADEPTRRAARGALEREGHLVVETRTLKEMPAPRLLSGPDE